MAKMLRSVPPRLSRRSLAQAIFLAYGCLVVQSARSEELSRIGPPVVRVPAFYATDREKITSNQESDGNKLSPLHMGCATVTLPASSDWLPESTGQLAPRYTDLGWKLDANSWTYAPYIELRGYVAEDSKPQVLLDVQDCSDFWQQLTSGAKASRTKTVYVYIHGFASSGDNAIYSTGILSAWLEAPVVAFTWPSAGKAGLKPLRLVGKKRMRALYLADRKMIDEPQVMSDLVRFIKEMKAQLPPDVSVSLIAHSLGNRLMARYLAGGSTETFDSVHFIAADVDEKLFMDAARKLSTKSKRTSVYVNPSDRVLAVSGANDLLSLRITNKLGRSGFSVPSVEFLNYQQIAEPKSWEYLNVQHYLPFEHFGNIERTGAPYRGVNKGLFIVRRSSVEKGR